MAKVSKYKCYGSTSQGEYTLCGDAFDLCELDDEEAETPRFAKPGEKVTCPQCQRQIKDIFDNVTAGFMVKRETSSRRGPEREDDSQWRKHRTSKR